MRLHAMGLVFGASVSVLLAGCGVTIYPPKPTTLTITTTSLPAGTIGVAYTAGLGLSGGVAPFTWSIANGTLPAGLSLSASGAILGTPTAVGSTSFTVMVTDSEKKSQSATASLTLAINAPKLAITTTSLAAGQVGMAYIATQFAAIGGVTPYTWSIDPTGPPLPTGLSLSSSGSLSGTPTVAGSTSPTFVVADAEATPQTAKASLQLTISAPKLVVTTTSLAAGQVGVAYTATLAAMGGVPPYTWTVGPSGPPLPTGVSLSMSGILSGTPTISSSTSPDFVVTDSETPAQVASANLQLTIKPANSNLTDNRYAFVFSGNGPNGAIAIDGTFLVSQGNIVSGTYDENANGSTPLLNGNIGGGTVTTGSGLGQLELTLVGAPNGANVKFMFAAPVTGSDIRLIEFDDTTGKGTRGSGLLKLAVEQPLTTLSDSFALSLSGSFAGESNADASIIGSIQTDGNGHIIGGNTYQCVTGSACSAISNITGTYSINSQTYRGQLMLNLGRGKFNYSFYQVSPGELMTITTDSTASAPLAAGSMLQQQGSPYSNAFLSGTSVLTLNGQVRGNTNADVILGLVTFDGKGGITIVNDEYNNALLPPQTYPGATYAVADATTGWVTVDDESSHRLYDMYLIDSKTAFVQEGTSAVSGLIEAQTGAPFTNASFQSDYSGGSIPLPGPLANNQVSVVSPNGGFLSIVSDVSGPNGLQTGQTLTGTYAVDATGRTIVTAADGIARIFYIVSPAKAALLSGEGGGYLGSFEK